MDEPFLFEKLFRHQKIEDLGESDLYKKSKLMETEFTNLVDLMREERYLPLPSINNLVTLLWRIVGNRIAPVAMAQSVSTLSFWCEMQQKNGVPRSIAIILMPENWHDMLVKNPHEQMGAIVFAASHAKDYWNHKFLPPNTPIEAKERAWSNESELLHYFSRNVPNFKPTEYQFHIMQKYPLGTKSVASNYVGRKYDGIFPPYPVK